jgi:hypothetical protein
MEAKDQDAYVGSAEPEVDADLEWFQSSDESGRGVVSGVDFTQKEVEFSVVNGKAIFEGDIVLFTEDQLAELSESGRAGDRADDTVTADGIARGVGITGQRYRWPRGIIPYEINPSMPNQQRVTDAIAHVEQNTRLRFVRRTAANATQYPNYVRFEALDGCWSYVGMRGGMQQISLGTGCGFGAAVHEILHAAGIWHEQSREDRESFCTIHWENIAPTHRHNFNQHILDGDDLGNYDFDSLMHYGRFAFSMNGQPTITTVGGQPIGQRNGMSAGDIAAIRALYPHLEPSQSWRGVQFTGTVPANSTRRWFTHSWPHHWYVIWTVVPTAPVQDGPAQIKWKVLVEKQAETLLKYYIEVQNLRPHPVTVEARYDVLGWSEHTF